jgi:hypothetical protein
MKVLTHEGVLVTLPFTLNDLKENQFERIDGKGASEVGAVSEMSRAPSAGWSASQKHSRRTTRRRAT